jgi:hypothetical protein
MDFVWMLAVSQLLHRFQNLTSGLGKRSSGFSKEYEMSDSETHKRYMLLMDVKKQTGI